MEKKLSRDSISRIDDAVERLAAAWQELKITWSQEDSLESMDKAFYGFVALWLDIDRRVDRELHAHTLEYWNDPELEVVRQMVSRLQVHLTKIDDRERKYQGVLKLQQLLEKIEF